jgi:hypothetical protein|tara:strand:- start:155 stop:475 length:321 start_codon:yes stop_codon:yes gene_type:complete
MKIIKLLSAIKNADQIFEGIKNNIFKSDDVELVADERWNICKDCQSLDNSGKNCTAPGTQPCCSDCGCSLAYKLRALSSSCPTGQWAAVLSEDLEKQFKDKTGYKE